MIRRIALFAALFFLAAGNIAPASAAGKLNQQHKVELQVALMEYIDANSVDGKFVYFDARTQQMVELFPANLHPMIVPTSSVYFLCADFRDAKGYKVDVDFVATHSEDGFIVFQAMVNQRHIVREMMKGRDA